MCHKVKELFSVFSMEWKCDFSEVVVCDQHIKHVHNQTSDSKLLLSGSLRTAGAMVLACANPAIPSPWGLSIPTAPQDGRQRIVPTAVRWVCPMWPATKIAWIPWTMHWPFSEDGRLLGGWGRFFFFRLSWCKSLGESLMVDISVVDGVCKPT